MVAMKDILIHKTSAERRDFIRGLFKTVHMDPSSCLYDLIYDAAQIPIVFCEYSNPELEWSNFYSWLNVLPLRTGCYTNPYIADLYLVHELFHIVNKVTGFHDIQSWADNKIAEEFEASLFSEMSVYDNGIFSRKNTFSFPILWDETMLDGANSRNYRRSVMVRQDPKTDAQKLLVEYVETNWAWCRVWGTYARETEWHMDRLAREAVSLEEHVEWLKKAMGEGDIPFISGVKEFHKISKHIKERQTYAQKVQP